MKQQEVFKKIGVIINELNEQYEYLKTIDGLLNELELELFIANSHFLTDHVVILNKLNTQSLAAPKPVVTEQPLVEEKPVVVEKILPPIEELPPLLDDKSPFIEEAPIVANDLPPLIEAKSPFVEETTPEVSDLPPLVEEKNFEVEHPAPEPKYFEPLVQSVTQHGRDSYIAEEEDKTPTPHIDLGSADDGDSYSYTRDEEPETIRHELILDEADWGDEDEAYETALVEEAADVEEPVVEEEIIEVPPAAAKPIIVEHIEELKPVIPQPAPQPVRDPAKEEVLTINERISAQLSSKAANITEQLGVQKIDDLKQAINLNDKLLYIKDLFNGYSLAYSEAIDILNRFANFEEADTFLNKNYVAKNQWESKPDTTAKFYALLKRRYA